MYGGHVFTLNHIDPVFMKQKPPNNFCTCAIIFTPVSNFLSRSFISNHQMSLEMTWLNCCQCVNGGGLTVVSTWCLLGQQKKFTRRLPSHTATNSSVNFTWSYPEATETSSHSLLHNTACLITQSVEYTCISYRVLQLVFSSHCFSKAELLFKVSHSCTQDPQPPNHKQNWTRVAASCE